MITSNINFKQLEDRIDAEYYKPEYLGIEKRLNNSSNVFYLRDLVEAIQHPREFKREYSSSDRGIPYLRVSNVKDGYIDKSDIEYVNLENNIGLNRIYEGNILITRSGTVGIPVLVTDEYDGMLISADFLKVVLKTEIKNVTINPYYIYTFLSSRFGRLQEERKLIGALQKHIDTQGLSSIRIFIPPQLFQLQIEKMVKEAEEKRKLAEEKYKEAEEVLNKELGIEDLDLSTQKTFETKFSEIDRLDPEQYQPKYKVILDHLNKIQHTEINKIAMFNQRGVQPEYTNRVTGYMALTSKCIGKKYIDYDSMPNITEDFYYSSKEAKLTNGDMVIYTTGAYVGNTQAITGDINAIASNHVNILRVKDFDPVFLSFYFNSIPGQLQIKKLVSGAAQAELYPRDIEKIIVPKISTSTQQKISKLIQESFCFRKESKKLINDAKRKVEEMIEK